MSAEDYEKLKALWRMKDLYAADHPIWAEQYTDPEVDALVDKKTGESIYRDSMYPDIPARGFEFPEPFGTALGLRSTTEYGKVDPLRIGRVTAPPKPTYPKVEVNPLAILDLKSGKPSNRTMAYLASVYPRRRESNVLDFKQWVKGLTGSAYEAETNPKYTDEALKSALSKK